MTAAASHPARLLSEPKRRLKTTLKRGIGRGGVLEGNGHSVLPPSALSPMSRYRVEEPPRRSGLRLVGRILLWLAIGILMLAVSFVAGLYLFFHQSVAAVQAHSKDVKAAQKLLGEPPPPGHAAIALVIGYDHRANEAAGTPSRSDTVMLVRTDPTTHTISMMSFPRDLIVDVHCPGQPVYSGKINSAYATCGAKGTVQTVSDLIGLPINYLITVNFRGFKQIVNKLGGVWIDVDRRYFNDNAGLSPSFGYATINLQPGYRLLTGGSALDYVRYRHTDSDLFRVARQQQFVKAMKYQFKHSFTVLKVPGIVGALTKNIEVAAGGGGGVSGRTILSYAFFAYHLPAGHFFQTQIQGLSGYSDLRTDPSNIAAAVQAWETPDVKAAEVATAVALGRKVRLHTPTPAQTSITVLNGNGVAGSAGEAGNGLSQLGYRIVALPANATGNAPTFDYFHTTVYWNPSVPRSAAAANQVAKLFAPADVKKVPASIASLQNGAMLTVVVGRTFHGSVAPAAPTPAPVTRQPAQVRSNPYDTAGPLRGVRKKVGFPLQVPTVIESSSSPDSKTPMYAYRINSNDHAVRLVFETAAGAYWGVEETAWDGAPVLSDRSFRHVLGGRTYDFYYNGPKLHMIVLREGGATYWVVNSLLDNLSNETMIAIAKGLKPLKAK
jgi:LCP family protein required for cell wall assembly